MGARRRAEQQEERDGHRWREDRRREQNAREKVSSWGRIGGLGS